MTQSYTRMGDKELTELTQEGTVRIDFYLHKEIKDELCKIAEYTGQSLSDVIREALMVEIGHFNQQLAKMPKSEAT